MRDRMEKALKKSKADYTEIRLEDVTSSGINFMSKELDTVASAKSTGGIVRALHKGGWGYATFNDLNDLDVRVKEACESAKLTGKTESKLAPIEPIIDIMKAEMIRDFREVPLTEKKAVMEEYNNIVLKYDKKIETTQVGCMDNFRKVCYINSEGTYIEDERPYIAAYIAAVARDGNNVQQVYERGGGQDEFQMIEGLQKKAETAAKRAVDLLSAPPVTGGKYTVVLDPVLAGGFAHEAFNHLSEADFVSQNEQMKAVMVLGKKFGAGILNIIDDGSFPGQSGTHKYDDEGIKTGKNCLIKDDLLVGRLHSRETAGKMEEKPTGNARATAYNNEPIVRMTNTYIDKGTSKFEDMIKDIKLGIYACNMFGGMTQLEMFTFSAGYGFMIRDGKIAELVRDVVLTGNVFETMMNIDMIENKISWAPGGPGGCGKSNQMIPVGIGSPHIRIQNLIAGGRQ
jgi:TldD protein